MRNAIEVGGRFYNFFAGRDVTEGQRDFEKYHFRLPQHYDRPQLGPEIFLSLTEKFDRVFWTIMPKLVQIVVFCKACCECEIMNDS